MILDILKYVVTLHRINNFPMIRKILSLLLLFVPIYIMAQNTPDSTAQTEEQRIEISNRKCRLEFTDLGLISAQNSSKDFLVYEVPGMSAAELKAATLNTILSMYCSPKDVVTTLSENMIQLEGYISRAYFSKAGDSLYPVDFTFTWTMQFKDGKIRINIPKIKQIYITGVPLMGSLKLDMTKPIQVLVDDDSNRSMVAYSLNKLIDAICKNVKSANDW